MIKKLLFASAIAILSIASSDAQTLKTPVPSPATTVNQDFGLANIQLSYSSPGMKGRKIFGDVVPFGKVWRTGANEPTIFYAPIPLRVAGLKVPLPARSRTSRLARGQSATPLSSPFRK